MPLYMRVLQPLAKLPGAGLAEARLVQTSDDAPAYWTTELGKHLLRYSSTNFMDITSFPSLSPSSWQAAEGDSLSVLSSEPSFPSKPSHSKQLQAVFANVTEAGPRKNLEGFTSFRNRYYKSETGKQSQQWLLKLIKSVVEDVDYISVREHTHSWGQNSIILRVAGSQAAAAAQKKSPEVAAILGAHLDSTHMIPFFAAPGADDDGSGSVTLIEALRALLSQGWQPERNVEFHWYSAEEGGLLGSQEVAQSYASKGVTVGAMLQQDMTAFVKPGTQPRVGMVADFVSEPLTAFIQTLVEEYLEIPPVPTKLGYAGSDHASWTKIGVPSAFAIEATFEDSNLKNIHTGNDRMDIEGFSFEHLVQFVRLSSAFAVELGGWAK
ncbi:Zn-dependent exopeptidase [Tilletiopsis washingtonensis]|uniref:Peptide hydrolase n=1 Tax=Tilletiopsis washingtonensis TaxID=58919 RepID=A0A316Z162_9BASI|nr:Zn-dependent exopeptidase [Tilletiopsis washingtonensis]PWN95527.1 Zn-dependent exopeptidase [Tilletiopsis washingtonensis]